jgi:hypothetical protein
MSSRIVFAAPVLAIRRPPQVTLAWNVTVGMLVGYFLPRNWLLDLTGAIAFDISSVEEWKPAA